MNVTCPNCKEIYSIQIDLFREKNQQLECVNCGHQWDQNLSNKEIQKAEKLHDLLSARVDRSLTSKQVSKILKEEAEFNKKYKKVLINQTIDKKNSLNSEVKDQELSLLEMLKSKEFWIGFSISLVSGIVVSLVYLYADSIIENFPYLKNYIDRLVEFVNFNKNWIGMQKKQLINSIMVLVF